MLVRRWLGLAVIIVFLVNVGLAAAGISYGADPFSLPTGVSYVNPALLSLTPNSALPGTLFPEMTLNSSQSDLLRKLLGGDFRTISIDSLKREFLAFPDPAKKGAPVIIDLGSGAGTPRGLVNYLSGSHVPDLVAQGICKSAASCQSDLQAYVYSSTSNAAMLSQKYMYGYAIAEGCKNFAGGACTFQSYGSLWVPGYVSRSLARAASGGANQVQMFAGLLNAGFDPGFAVASIQDYNATGGVNYAGSGLEGSTKQVNVDPTIYGVNSYTIRIPVPTYVFTGAGQLVFPDNPTWGGFGYGANVGQLAGTYKDWNCGGLSCLHGGGYTYLIIPEAVVQKVGISTVRSVNDIFFVLANKAAAGPLIVYKDGTTQPDCVSHARCVPITESAWKMFIQRLTTLRAALREYSQLTGYDVTQFRSVPLNSFIPELSYGAFPDPASYYLNKILTTGQPPANAAEFNAGYAKSMYEWLGDWGWTQTDYVITHQYIPVLKLQGYTPSQITALLAQINAARTYATTHKPQIQGRSLATGITAWMSNASIFGYTNNDGSFKPTTQQVKNLLDVLAKMSPDQFKALVESILGGGQKAYDYLTSQGITDPGTLGSFWDYVTANASGFTTVLGDAAATKALLVALQDCAKEGGKASCKSVFGSGGIIGKLPLDPLDPTETDYTGPITGESGTGEPTGRTPGTPHLIAVSLLEFLPSPYAGSYGSTNGLTSALTVNMASVTNNPTGLPSISVLPYGLDTLNLQVGGFTINMLWFVALIVVGAVPIFFPKTKREKKMERKKGWAW